MIQLPKAIKPVVLVILDGWGIAPSSSGNAITQADLPYYRSISTSFPHTSLLASGKAVGLPESEEGNSEVGHLNLGAGRIVHQDLTRINEAISDQSFFQNTVLKETFAFTTTKNSRLHLLGLVGIGKEHASVEHLYALLLAAKEQGVKDIYLHLFTDGRDSSPTAARNLLPQIQEKLNSFGVGKIVSLMGRYWGMDRDKRWERTQRAYNCIVSGEGNLASSVQSLITSSYAKNITDEFIEPTLISQNGRDTVTVNDGDSVVFFNFRPDRARQLTQAFVEKDFKGFQRERTLTNLCFTTLTEYDQKLAVKVVFPPKFINDSLAQVLSSHNLRQLHISETEKYAHVTYFFNGGREEAYPREDRVHIPSPKVATYDQKPEMSAREITSYVIAKLRENVYDFYVINFANADMVAHTGSLSATIKALETLDTCLKEIGKEVTIKGGVMIVTADHGNAESLIDPFTGGVDTEHNANKVPFIVVGNEFAHSTTLEFPVGKLADVAPTVLSLLGITKPGSMLGEDLLNIHVLNKEFN